MKQNVEEIILVLIKRLVHDHSGDIKATCLDRKNICKEGCCNAALEQKEMSDTFSLITGIIPNADAFGSANFRVKDVQEVLISGIIVLAHFNNNRAYRIKLESKCRKNI